MSITTIEVSHEIWQWVLSTAMLNDTSQSILQKWMSGDKLPTYNQIARLGQALQATLKYPM